MSIPVFPKIYIPFAPGNKGQALKTSTTEPLGAARCLKTSSINTTKIFSGAGGAEGLRYDPYVMLTSDKRSAKSKNISSKLFAEAEKLQKWKTSVEIELQQKEKKLQDTYREIDSLRKDALDLRLQNEALRMKINQEVQNRNDVFQKHESTRELCIAVKKQLVGVEEKIEYAQRMKENFEMIQNERIKAFEDLAGKFDALQQTHMEQIETFTNIVNSREREMNALREACNNQLSEANKQVVGLQAKLESAEEAQEELREENSKLKSTLCEVQEEKNYLSTALEAEKAKMKHVSEHVSKPTGLGLPQKRVGTGKPVEAVSHQSPGRCGSFQDQDNANKKLKLDDNESNQNALGNKNVEEGAKGISPCKFKSQHSPAVQKEPDLCWFDVDTKHGFSE